MGWAWRGRERASFFIKLNVVVLLFCFHTPKAFKTKLNCINGQAVCYPKPGTQGNFYLVVYSKSLSLSLSLTPSPPPPATPSQLSGVGVGVGVWVVAQ